MDVQLPDGTVLQNIPDGMTKAELSQKLQANGMGYMLVSPEIANDPTSQGARNFAKDMPLGQQVLAGTGKAYADIGRGASQLVGAGPSAAEVAEQRRLDRPLMRTPGGVTGNVVGNITALAPLAVVPGANTVAGAGALGATIGALQPTETPEERLLNMGKGFATSAGTQYVATKGATALGHRAADLERQSQLRSSQNAVRDQTLKQAREAGYKVPPSAVNPSFLNKRLESVAGKAAVGQEAAIRNQGVTDAIARAEAGLPPQQALSETALSGARKTAAEPYRQVASLNPQTATDLEAWKAANLEAKLQWNYYNRTGHPDAYKAAIAAQNQAEGLLNNIEAQAQSHLQAGAINNPRLVSELKEARKQIAKIHNVENAVNVGTGSVDASVLGRALDRGAPLTGGLRTVAQFQQAFPSYAREASRIPTPGVSKSEALAAALLATAGAGAGGPKGLFAGGLPLLSGPARSLVLSEPYQKLMATPNYSSGALTQAAAKALPPDRAAMLARALLAAPAIARPSSE